MAATQDTLSNAPNAFIQEAANWSLYLANRLSAESDFEDRLAMDIQSPLRPSRIDTFFDTEITNLLPPSSDDHQSQLHLLRRGDLRDILEQPANHHALKDEVGIDDHRLRVAVSW